MYEKIYHLYLSICVFVTIVLTSWCLYEYLVDPDVSSIHLRKFHARPDDIHPSITLCDRNLFSKGSLVGQSWSVANQLDDYYGLIGGTALNLNQKYIQELNDIDYDNVTVSLNDLLKTFIIDIVLSFDQTDSLVYSVVGNYLVINKSETTLSNNSTLLDFKSLERISVSISIRAARFKCFTFDIPMIKGVIIRKVQIDMNIPLDSSGIPLSRYFVMLTFPNQTLQVSPGKRIYLNKHHRRRQFCYQFQVNIGAMDVFHRRDKPDERCNIDWKNHDQVLRNYIIEKSRCKPKHWNTQSNVEYCNSVDQYKTINEKLFETGVFMPPCRSIERLSTTTNGKKVKFCPIGKQYLKLLFYLDEDTFYREIKVVPAYPFKSLVGNAGMLERPLWHYLFISIYGFAIIL